MNDGNNINSEDLSKFKSKNETKIDDIWNEFDQDKDGYLNDIEFAHFVIRLIQESVLAETGRLPTKKECKKHVPKIKQQIMSHFGDDSGEMLSKKQFKLYGQTLMYSIISLYEKSRKTSGDNLTNEAILKRSADILE
eukprot:UN02000